MPNEAMNLTFGDFLIMEIALLHYVKELDLSLQSGQFISELVGKIEYNISQLKSASNVQLSPGLDPRGLGTK